jgi:hypothetical protein
MRPRTRIFIVAAAAVLLVASALAVLLYSRRGVLVTVHNAGNDTITDVRVAISDRVLLLGDIPPQGASGDRAVPGPESDVAVTFTDGAGARHIVRVDTYVEHGMRGRVDVDIQNGQLKGSKTDLHYYGF